MRKYWLVDRRAGDAIEVDEDEVFRIVGVEIEYLEWVIEADGNFENQDWDVKTVES